MRKLAAPFVAYSEPLYQLESLPRPNSCHRLSTDSTASQDRAPDPLQRDPSSSLCRSRSLSTIVDDVEGVAPFTNREIACSVGSFIRFLKANMS